MSGGATWRILEEMAIDTHGRLAVAIDDGCVVVLLEKSDGRWAPHGWLPPAALSAVARSAEVLAAERGGPDAPSA